MKEQAQRQTRFQSKAESCGICYNAIENQGVLDSCNHSFCSDCIKNGQILKTHVLYANRNSPKLNPSGREYILKLIQVHYKSHKISKRKCKQNKIYVKDKSQSQKEDQFNVLLEILIEFILADIND